MLSARPFLQSMVERVSIAYLIMQLVVGLQEGHSWYIAMDRAFATPRRVGGNVCRGSEARRRRWTRQECRPLSIEDILSRQVVRQCLQTYAVGEPEEDQLTLEQRHHLRKW